jgi:DDE family transposase
MVALVECGTHAVLDAELDGCRVGETTLAARLVRSVGPGMLVLADREFLGVPLWRAVAATGAHLLWRVPANRVLDVEQALPDGSWWWSTYAAGDRPARRHPVRVRVRVRVVAYDLDELRPQREGAYRLVTDLLDHQRYPARELAAPYPQRWEEETALDQLKTHQRGAGVVLTGKTPEGSANSCGRTCWSTMPCGR